MFQGFDYGGCAKRKTPSFCFFCLKMCCCEGPEGWRACRCKETDDVGGLCQDAESKTQFKDKVLQMHDDGNSSLLQHGEGRSRSGRRRSRRRSRGNSGTASAVDSVADVVTGLID